MTFFGTMLKYLGTPEKGNRNLDPIVAKGQGVGSSNAQLSSGQ